MSDETKCPKCGAGPFYDKSHLEYHLAYSRICLRRQLAAAKERIAEAERGEVKALQELHLGLARLADDIEAREKVVAEVVGELPHFVHKEIMVHQDIVGWQEGENRNAAIKEIAESVGERIQKWLVDRLEGKD